MPTDQSRWLNNHQCIPPIEPAGQLGKTNRSAAVVGAAFFSRSLNRANCLRKNKFFAARDLRRHQILAKKLTPSLTTVQRFRANLQSRVKTLNILQSSHG